MIAAFRVLFLPLRKSVFRARDQATAAMPSLSEPSSPSRAAINSQLIIAVNEPTL